MTARSSSAIFHIEIPKFRLWPIVLMILLGLGLPILAANIAQLASHFLGLPSVKGAELPWLYSQHAFQLLLALCAIAIAKRYFPVDYGLHMPRGKTYLLPATLWGIFFGVLMIAVGYGPQLIARQAPHLDYALTSTNVFGWLFFEGVYVGPTEEVPFRALLVTLLAAMLPGRVRLFRYEMNVAGVIVAAVFAIAHVGSFWTSPIPMALAQQGYAFALGVLYAYWLEKSKSILAPIVGHNVSDVTEQALLFAAVAAWR